MGRFLRSYGCRIRLTKSRVIGGYFPQGRRGDFPILQMYSKFPLLSLLSSVCCSTFRFSIIDMGVRPQDPNVVRNSTSSLQFSKLSQ